MFIHVLMLHGNIQLFSHLDLESCLVRPLFSFVDTFPLRPQHDVVGHAGHVSEVFIKSLPHFS